MIAKLFSNHPRATGETYAEHQRFAALVGFRLLGAGAAALIHGIFPFLFVTTAGRAIDDLHDLIHRRRAAGRKPAGDGVTPQW